MTPASPPAEGPTTIIRAWLYIVAGLVFLMVVVGGATRLTESGLSIVEWKPVTGTLPPLSEGEWTAEFEKYKTIPQYHVLNKGMTLSEFKTIFWWEWGHRLLGRIIGVAFFIPFLWFISRGWVSRELKRRLWFIFGLGALQGAAGWWMVASGLADRTEVSQYRLAIHLVLACVIFMAMVWTAERMAGRKAAPATARLGASAAFLALLVLFQIYLGAIVAGLRAGLTYNTWPLMDGQLIPPLSDLFTMQPAWRNAFENPLTVQFNHRMTGYVLWIVSIAHAIDVARSGWREHAAIAAAIAAAVTVQAALGIFTLIYQVPILLALAHQAAAIAILGLSVAHAQRLIPRRRKTTAAAAAVARA